MKKINNSLECGCGYQLSDVAQSKETIRPEIVTDTDRSIQYPSFEAYMRPVFPLTVGVMMNLCTRCWHPDQTRPLCQETGEEAYFGYYYGNELRTECSLLLQRSIAIMDIWEIQSAKATFIANPAVFQCKSILIVLYAYEEYMLELSDWDCFAPPKRDLSSTVIGQAEEYVAKHSLPRDTHEY